MTERSKEEDIEARHKGCWREAVPVSSSDNKLSGSSVENRPKMESPENSDPGGLGGLCTRPLCFILS